MAFRISILIAFIALSSCSLLGREQVKTLANNINTQQNPNANENPLPTSPNPFMEISFQKVNGEVLETNCNRCHNPQHDGDARKTIFDTESEFAKLVDKIDNSVFVDKEMPPRKATQLNEGQLVLLKTWIDKVRGNTNSAAALLTKPNSGPNSSQTSATVKDEEHQMSYLPAPAIANVASAAPIILKGKENHPDITFEIGKPVVVRFPNGNEATLVSQGFVLENDLRANIEIYESLCGPIQKLKCVLQLGYAGYRTTLIWSKHTDPAKIGQVLKNKQINAAVIDSTDNNIGTTANASAGLNPQRLVCPSFEWLGSGQKIAPEAANIAAVYNDIMTNNPETGVDENIQSLGVRDVQFAKTSDQVLTMTEFKGDDSGFPIILFGDASALHFQNKQGQTCQVSAKLQTSSVISAVRKFDMYVMAQPLSNSKVFLWDNFATFRKSSTVYNTLENLASYYDLGNIE